MESSVVTRRGHITIPPRLWKRAGLNKGIRVYLEEKDGDIIVHPAMSIPQIPQCLYERFYGILRGGKLTKRLEKERRKEIKREEKKFEPKK